VLAMRNDYKVDFRREEIFAEAAFSWRVTAENQNFPDFNIVRFVEAVLLPKTKRPFKIEFFDAKEGEKPAFVTFNPRTLHVDNETWRLADLGEPDSRFVIAHEVGHLLFHDHHAKAFSNDPDDQIKFDRPEYSAEWQANTFAFYFLVPDHILAAYDDIKRLSHACNVTEEIARQRLAMTPHAARRYSAKECGICPNCGNFSLSPNGNCLAEACKR
jgi:hypothetical protein